MKAEEEKRMRHSPAPDHHDQRAGDRLHLRIPTFIAMSTAFEQLERLGCNCRHSFSSSVPACLVVYTTLGWAVKVQEQRVRK